MRTVARRWLLLDDVEEKATAPGAGQMAQGSSQAAPMLRFPQRRGGSIGAFREPMEFEPPPAPVPPTPSELRRARLRQLRRRGAPFAIFASGIMAALVAVLLYQALSPSPHLLTTSDVKGTIAQAFASVTPQPALSERVYQVIQPSMVLVQAQSAGANGGIEHGLGTGVIINDQGDILTSLHVVTQSTVIQLTFADGTTSAAEISSQQPDHDIAVLKAQQPPAKIVPATLGNPNASHIGDEAFVVGNPFGLTGSMSAGVISGFNRSFQPVTSSIKLQDMIQIDAAVNPGNSGGPLLNRYGEVIGIVTGLVNPTAQDFFVGIGFAVPINMAGPGGGSPPY
ncbi:MAG: trypsin-like peptidase domain-containing protein [Chloroflexota bacterium]|nr:trypsin-like peptidase domain-containing protein [Chloroflexota bacterium]